MNNPPTFAECERWLCPDELEVFRRACAKLTKARGKADTPPDLAGIGSDPDVACEWVLRRLAAVRRDTSTEPIWT